MATYADSAALAGDEEFRQRVAACTASEAQARPEPDELAALCLRSPITGAGYFMPFITTDTGIVDFYADPGGGGQSNVPDQAILSAVQADWAKVAAVYGLN